MYLITAILATYVAVSHGYAIVRLTQEVPERGETKYLGVFIAWNTLAAIAVVSVAAYWQARHGLGETLLTLIMIAMTPHIVILAGNLANCARAMRTGVALWVIVFLVSWIVMSIFTITMVGAVSPYTYLIRILL